jgi:hypothetical protein
MFQVEWLEETLNQLADLWVNADSNLRQAITAATHAIDAELQDDPYRQSESREQEERVLFVHPLGVRFEVDDDKRVVWVLDVWRFRHRGEQ